MSSAPQTHPQQSLNQSSSGGMNLLGTTTTQSANQQAGFQPISNTNPNKIMAYENQHVQIWMDCIKESGDTTKLFTTYINKTNSTLTDLTIQAAVLKHVKLNINPLSSTTLQPYSKEVVHQVFIYYIDNDGSKFNDWTERSCYENEIILYDCPSKI